MTIIQSRSAFRSFAASLLRRPGRVDAQARLPEGLALTFARLPDGCRRRWKLVLAREDSFPTPDEVEACCQAFRIPPSVTERRMRHFTAHPKSGRRIHAHIVELVWHEEHEETPQHEEAR